jgi:hypothetical protein
MASKKPKGPPEKVLECGIEKDDENFVYFVDRRGNLTRMARGGKGDCEVLLAKCVKREKGFMYYLDDDGDLVREPDNSRG